MKKRLSRLLCAALIAVMVMSLFAVSSADAENTKVVIPSTAKKLQSVLPEREQPVTMRTKTKDGIIMVRVHGEPDEVVAQWMGYDEEYEVVEFENGIGYIETEGHKYQLGAAPNNVVYRNYYRLDKNGDIMLDANGEKMEIDVKGTINNVFTPGDKWYLTPQWISDAKQGFVGWVDPKAKPYLPTTGTGTVIADPVKDTAVTAYDTTANGGHKKVTYVGGTSSDPTGFYQHSSEAYVNDAGIVIGHNDVIQDIAGNVVYENTEITPMVDASTILKDVHGKESDGSPNYAYSVTKGDWNGVYTRAGNLKYCTKTEENTDYFKTGLAGNKGEVIWRSSTSKGRTVWYLASVTETYEEGDIAEAVAEYNIKGQLKDYILTYRTGEDETYRIKYNKYNRPIYGWYKGFDAWGTEIEAYTNSTRSWRDKETGWLDTCFELDWNLIKLSAFTNPPRKTK